MNQSSHLECHPIGHFFCHQSEKYMAPKQAELGVEAFGRVVLNPCQNFEQALEALHGFERIWLIYWLHRNQHWKPKVSTPRGGAKRGVFGTRSPHRPNPLGLSCVQLIDIRGRELIVGKNDLLDQTPILDIKPYLPYADAFPDARQGWTQEEEANELFEVHWNAHAQAQADFIKLHGNFSIVDMVELRLRTNPYPFPSHRIKQLAENLYEIAAKTWRVHYSISSQCVLIEKIETGYDVETLQGKQASRWDDVPIHVKFVETFSEL